MRLFEDCPPSLQVDDEMPADEALKQHKKFFNQNLPEAVQSLKEAVDQMSQPDQQTLDKLAQVEL